MAMVSIALNPETGDVMGFLLGYKKPEKPRKMGFNIGLYIYNPHFRKPPYGIY